MKKAFLEHQYLPFLILFIIVLLSRLPFLWAGYGIEEDSWAIAISTYLTKTTGIVEPSRLPGHPVHEFPLVWLWNGGYQLSNFLSALYSGIGTVFFALILKHFNFKLYFIAALAFAFVPIYYISSTYTIDFVFSETYVLIALYLLLKEKYYLVGIFLGLAIGCRITSGAMLLPFMIIVWQKNSLKQNFYTLLKIGIPMTIVAIATFIPIMQQYGKDFFMYYDQFPYPSIPKFIYKLIFGVWGFIGTMALLTAKIYYFINKKNITKGELYEKEISKKIITAAITVIALYIISYFRLPQKSGYMIPIIPFAILLAGYYLNKKAFKFLCFALIISPFICSINLTDKYRGAEYSNYALKATISGQEIFFDFFSGPIFSDYSKRKQKLKYTDAVIEKVKSISKKTIIIAGWWYNEITVKMLNQQKNSLVIFEAYINQEKINEHIKNGYELYYLPEQNLYNDLMYKMKLTDSISSPFSIEKESN